MKAQAKSVWFALLMVTFLFLSLGIKELVLYSDIQFNEDLENIKIKEIRESKESRMGTPVEYASIYRNLGHGTDIGLYDSLVVKNVDDDMEKEVIFGNAQGYVHVLEYNGEDTTDQWVSDKKDKTTHAVAVDDIDKDGRMEIAFTTNTGLVHIYEWNGTSFAWRWTSTPLGSGTSVNPYKTVIADTNSDGINEIIVGVKDGRIIGFNGSNPSSTVGEPNSWTITKGQLPYGILVTDCEYDGKKEIIVGFDAGDVYIFNGLDKSVRAYSDRLGGESFGLSVGDIDKDGFKELAVSGDKCVYFFNLSNLDLDNSGNWTSADAKFQTPNVQSNMYAIELADVDNDGEIELICGGGTASSGKLYIYKWNGSGLEQTFEPFVDDCEITSIVVDDINNDLANELVFSDSFGFMYVCSCTQDGIELLWGLNSVFSEPFGLVVSDIDNDLANDLVVGTGSGYVEVLNLYVETLGFEQIAYFSEDYGTDMFGIKVIDIDLDGNVEFIIGSGSSKVLIIEPDVSTGSFNLEWVMELMASSSFALDVGDVNGDGIKEIIVGDSDGYMYIWRYAPGSGEGTPPNYARVWKSEDLGEGINFIHAEDIDNDGNAEIISGNANGTVQIIEYLYNEDSYSVTWTSPRLGTLSTASATCIDVCDYDKDGILEFVVGENHGYICIFDSKTHIQEYQLRLGTSKICGIRVYDLDLDGVNEILACANTGLVYSFSLKNGYKLEWQSDSIAESAGSQNSIYVSDIDDDGSVEAIISASGYIYIFRFAIYHNNPPAIVSATPNSHSCIINEPESQQFSITVTDADNDPIRYKWFRNGTEISLNSNTYLLTTNYTSAGFFVLRVEAWDNDTFASWNWTVTIIDVNPPPVIESYSPASDKNIDEGSSVNFEVSASDANDPTLYYTWYLDGIVVLTGPSERQYTYNAVKYSSAGMHTIRVSVTDGDDMNIVEHSWSVIVNRLAGIELQGPAGQNVSAGKTVVYTFVLKNTGTGKDSFKINASSSNNWTLQVSVSNTPEMNANETRSILVSITVPKNLKKNTVDLLQLTATSNYRNMITKTVSVSTVGKAKVISDEGNNIFVIILAIIIMLIVLVLLFLWARRRAKVTTPIRTEYAQGSQSPQGYSTQNQSKQDNFQVESQDNIQQKAEQKPEERISESNENQGMKIKGKFPEGYVPGPYIPQGSQSNIGQASMNQSSDNPDTQKK